MIIKQLFRSWRSWRRRGKVVYIGVTDKDEAVGACRKKGFMDAIHKAKLEVVPERMKIGSLPWIPGMRWRRSFEESPLILLVCVTDTMACIS